MTAGALALLALIAVVVAWSIGPESSSDIARREISPSFEEAIKGRLPAMEASLDAALADLLGKAGDHYRIDKRATTCRPRGDEVLFVCVVVVMTVELRFSLVYYVIEANDDCWEAVPRRLEVSKGRSADLRERGFPRLKSCVFWKVAKGERLPSPPPRRGVATDDGSSPNCDPSYPEFCLPRPPPDFDCSDLSQTNFSVRRSEDDPHGFDRDRDGIGCERRGVREPKEGGPALLTNDCVNAMERPSKIILACGDANFYLEGLRWRDWGEETAVGEGTAMANECDPNCAEGQFKAYPGVTVHASRLRPCPNGDRHYTVVTYAFSGDSPFPPDSPGARDTTVPMPCPGQGDYRG